MLPRGRELAGWGGILAGIYIFSGLGLSTQCLPLFFGGPAAILLCYAVVFVLLVLHLHRAPDRDDTVPVSALDGATGSAAASINTPILQDADASLPLSTFPEIEWRWERGVAITGAASAGIALLTKLCAICHIRPCMSRLHRHAPSCPNSPRASALNLVPGCCRCASIRRVPMVGVIGSTLVVLVLDWSGVVVGVLFFLTKACGGGMRLLVVPVAKPPGVAGGGSALAITVALFAVILVPALRENTITTPLQLDFRGCC